MKFFRAFWRLNKFVGITLFYMGRLILIELFKGKDWDRRERHKLRWGKVMVKNVGLKVDLEGELPQGSVLITPNHRSYIDIALVVSHTPASLLSKASVKKWPLIGQGAKMVNTMFVDRTSISSRKESVQEIAKRLQQGAMLCVFPEGTTIKSPGLGTFFRGSFSIAADHDIDVVPVAIEYHDVDDAWVGKDTFIPHFFKTFGKKEVKVSMAFGPRLTGDTGHELMNQSRSWIADKLSDLREDIGLPHE